MGLSVQLVLSLLHHIAKEHPMAILVSLCRRVRNEELDFPSDVNSANLFRLAMSRRPRDPICIVFR